MAAKLWGRNMYTGPGGGTYTALGVEFTLGQAGERIQGREVVCIAALEAGLTPGQVEAFTLGRVEVHTQVPVAACT